MLLWQVDAALLFTRGSKRQDWNWIQGSAACFRGVLPWSTGQQRRNLHWPREDLSRVWLTASGSRPSAAPTHVIRFSDLFDLWVINIEKPMILCIQNVARPDHLNRVQNTDQAGRKCERFVYSIVKILRLPTHLNGRHNSWGNSRGVQRFVGFSFLIVLFGCWLAEQSHSDHVTVTQVGMSARNLMQKWPRWKKPEVRIV